jgi:N-acetylmuramoyl-L-alanine amidase
MKIVDRPSPNHDARPDGQPVDILLIHYTDMESAESALARMTDPAARVSAHYCVDEDGTVYRLVPRSGGRACRQLRAGARYQRARSASSWSTGHTCGLSPFRRPDARTDELARGILARHPIPSHRVLGHSDVAPARKIDPGELFDWRRLARAGVGLWPDPLSLPDPGPAGLPLAVADLQSKLGRFGYAVAATGVLDEATRQALSAFQRHFRPAAFQGTPDGETRRILAAAVASASQL